MTSLNERQKRHLRALAHHRKPVVITGAAGLTPAVLQAVEEALAHHELIKVRVNAPDREARERMREDIARHTGAALVQSIGHVAVYYRPAATPVIALPP